MSNVVSNIKFHNNQQLDYFGQKIKKTIVPVSSPYVLRHVREVIEFAGIKRSNRIIDIACGMGKYTLNFLKQGYNDNMFSYTPQIFWTYLKN